MNIIVNGIFIDINNSKIYNSFESYTLIFLNDDSSVLNIGMNIFLHLFR